MIERDFDVSFVADLALREKQIQQNFRPIMAVHKWFARRPGTLFRALILSEFLEKPLRESFYQGQYEEAASRLASAKAAFVPQEDIPSGDETDRLPRWGYRFYREMFNARQLLGLELSARLLSQQKVPRIADALATNLSDLLRYQNMLCRYDTMALKSLDIFSVHGFPVGLIQCESNLIGVSGKTAAIGSGGWLNIVDKFAKAKAYCRQPFEIRHEGARKVTVPIAGEWIGEKRNGGAPADTKQVSLDCADATEVDFNGRKFDVVLTDPPYFGNVPYVQPAIKPVPEPRTRKRSHALRT